jgi:HSP20 family protein
MSLKSLLPINRNRTGVAPFTSLQREIDRLFEEFSRGFTSFPSVAAWGGSDVVPSVDVTESDKEIEITAELPGLEEKDVQINVSDGLLTIKGEKKSEKEEKDKNKNYRLVERSYGSFSRTLELPAGVDPDAIKATIDKGVLTVIVPKPAPAETRKIEVKAAA